MKFWGYIFALFSLNLSAFGQLEQSKRIEFEHNPNSDEERQVLPLGANGLLVIHSKVELFHQGLSLNFLKYDTTFTENWHTNFRPDDRFELAKTFDNGHFLYLLFREEGTVNIGILRLDFDTGDKSFTEGKLSANMDIEHFMVLKSKAIIGGKFNERPVVVVFSLFDSSVKVLPELHANNLIINELDINEATENIYVMLKNERGCQFILKTFSYEGRLLSTLTLGDKSHNPISGRILQIRDGELLLAGNYAEGCSVFSDGIYLNHLLDHEKPQYINFTDLKNFFKFLKPKREQRMTEKINQKKKQGKEVKLHYRLLLHNIIPQEDGFVMVAEIFYPEYKSPANSMFNSFRTYQIGSDVYNNFRYTHAIICGFDNTGNLIWDNCFSLDDLESSELNEKVQVTQTKDVLVLAYPKEGSIKTEAIRGSERVKSKEDFKMKPNSENEKIVSSDKTSLAAWYDQHFLAYGYQILKNEKGVLSQHEVFYINKLNYSFGNR